METWAVGTCVGECVVRWCNCIVVDSGMNWVEKVGNFLVGCVLFVVWE